MKKIIAIILVTILTLSASLAVYAHSWPDDINNWTTEDWRVWNEYWQNAWNNYNWNNYCYYNQQCDYSYGNQEILLDKPIQQTYSYQPCNYSYSQQATNKSSQYNYNGYNYYSGVMNMYVTEWEDQAKILAQIIYMYGYGVSSQTQQACIGWAVLNSADASGYNATVYTVANNFGSYSGCPTTDAYGRDLMPLARDLIWRWKAGKNGISSNGRVMPQGYNYVWSDGTSVWFRTTPNESGNVWNFSYSTPYSS